MKSKLNFKPKYVDPKLREQLSAIKVWILPGLSALILLVTVVLVLLPWWQDVSDKKSKITEKNNQITELLPKIELLQSQDETTLRGYLSQLKISIPHRAAPPLILGTVEQALRDAGLEVVTIQFGGLSDLSKDSVSAGSANTAVAEGVSPPTAADTGLSPDGTSSVVPPADSTAAVPPSGDAATPTASSQSIESGKVEVQLSAKGNYDQIVEFLKRFNKLNPLVLGLNLSVVAAQNNLDEMGVAQTVTSRELSFTAIAPYQELPADLGVSTVAVQVLTPQELSLIDEVSKFTSYYDYASTQDTKLFGSGRENPF